MGDLSKYANFIASGKGLCDRCDKNQGVIMTISEPIEIVCQACLSKSERKQIDSVEKKQEEDWK